MAATFEWSARMDRLFRLHVIEKVLDDPRSERESNVSLGLTFPKILQILKKGLADFSNGYDDGTIHLTPDEIVLLYSYVIMKKHFFACTASFEEYRPQIRKLLLKDIPMIVDIGCGPGTVGLAFADLFHGKDFYYAGIDLAAPSRRKAASLWKAAKTAKIITAKSIARFAKSWTNLNLPELGKSTRLLITASYFFGNPKVNDEVLRSLANWIDRMTIKYPQSNPILFYVNSPNDLANKKYRTFQKLVGFDPDKHPPIPSSITYRKKHGGLATSDEQFVHQLLDLTGGKQ